MGSISNSQMRLLITGPCGRVGRVMVPLLREHFALRLFDRAPASALPATERDEFIQGELHDFEALRRACEGVEAMIHLAAVPDEDDFHSRLLPANLEGVYNAFEAARQAGVKKVIFPSTGQTVLGYPRGQWVTTDMAPRPSTVYACTKLFGEALARHYSERHGMSILVIRLCYFQPYDSELLRQPGDIQREWCSPRDLEQLLLKCLRTDLRFGIFFGVSANTGRFWDTSNAQELLGYEPRDNAADYLKRPQ
jgi:uronate dehydrogenase